MFPRRSVRLQEKKAAASAKKENLAPIDEDGDMEEAVTKMMDLSLSPIANTSPVCQPTSPGFKEPPPSPDSPTEKRDQPSTSERAATVDLNSTIRPWAFDERDLDD